MFMFTCFRNKMHTCMHGCRVGACPPPGIIQDAIGNAAVSSVAEKPPALHEGVLVALVNPYPAHPMPHH